ncbi:galactosyltransferase-related protein [Priestia flexa]|uniref:galactosyltransferase-related protein n=1 Tax=Priestia flexa TaxID=86664 RepID=UPI000C23F953|nr:galactosyltransferase-related protein [Priestia flexa]MEC0664469.1 galactosyltransferase-related protein [Priestia flexa]MED3824658.1 galactosyltransferase-related protein [Priestia flexa]
MKNVSVIIPYKPDNGHRDIVFKWIKCFYKKSMPEVELCIGDCKSELFNRSQAINTAAQKATKDVFVIADGDVMYNPDVLVKAIRLLNKHAWIIPYSKCLDLSRSSTEKLLSSIPEWPLSIKGEYKERYKNKSFNPVGGLVVVTRKTFYAVGGFDERFIGWGGEDDAFAYAVNTLCGHFQRLDEKNYHLWHAVYRLVNCRKYQVSQFPRFLGNSGPPKLMKFGMKLSKK